MNEWLFRLIGLVLGQISPELRKAVVDWVTDMELEAKKTPNPWDDIFVGVIKSVLNIKTGN